MSKYTLKTLTISHDKEFSFEELAFLKALHTTINYFATIDRETSTLQLYINQSTFLIASFDKNEKLNPIAFIDEKGEILFDVEFSVFNKEFEAFKLHYLDYYKDRNMIKEDMARKAIIDYKNDKLDFYTDVNINISYLIEKARENYNAIYSL